MVAFVWILYIINGVFSERITEYGSYVNPHPRPYERCTAPDLIKLSSCCNDVLSKLDDCKADDLACECCALQSLKQECFNLCPGNPSNNFLTVLFLDCQALNDINACSLPFKKSDSLPSKKKKQQQQDMSYMETTDGANPNSVVIKSKLSPKIPAEKELIQLLQHDSDELPQEVNESDKEQIPDGNISSISTDGFNITGVTKKSISSSYQLGFISIIIGIIISTCV